MTQEILDSLRFWTIKRDASEKFVGLGIDQLGLCELLKYYGFIRFDIQDDMLFCRMTNNGKVIEPVTLTKIQDFVFDWVDDLGKTNLDLKVDDLPRQLKKKLLNGVTIYFNKQKLHQVRPDKPLVFNRDTLTTKFIYYQNGFVEINKKKVRLQPYSKLNNPIWESQILKRNINIDAKIERPTVEQFMALVSGEEQFPGRMFSLQTMVGYLLHDYYDYKLKMPLLTDSSIGDGMESNGRTGKTLFSRLIGHMISSNTSDPTIKSYVEIGMKMFKPDDPGRYSRVHYDTKLVVLNDLKPYFKIDSLYNDISDGMLVKHLYHDPFIVRVKMLANSNKTVILEGRSSTDRVLEFEFTDYFNDKRTPQIEFKHWFFSDWNTTDWNDFDLTMIKCIKYFLANECEMDVPQQINLNKRKLLDHTCDEFVEFVHNVWKPQVGKKYNIKETTAQFKNEYPDFDRPAAKFSQKRFTGWVKKYVNYNDELDNWNRKTNTPRNKEGTFYQLFNKNEE